METARLLIDPPLTGEQNMARDEALLRACVPPNTAPVLRFYAWSSPTISLGYFQDYAAYEGLGPPAGGLAVVRRTTGGGAILHDLEITYSLALPRDHPLVRLRPDRLYQLAHEAIAAAIGHGVRLLGADVPTASPAPSKDETHPPHCDAPSRHGPFFCFARRCGQDLVVDDPDGADGVSKIAGSAQRRTPQAVLQHGSIILGSRYTQQPVATWSALAGETIHFAAALDRLIPAFAAALGLDLDRDAWRPTDLAAAAALERKYGGTAWTVERRR